MPVVHHQGNAIHYEESGAGPALVLGHSFLCSGAMWREQVGPLSRAFRVINPDLRGHGLSGPATEPFTLYDAVADVTTLLDRLGERRAVWVGLSIGGMVALRAALTCPDRVAGLILIDTDAGAETAWHRLRYGLMALGVRTIGIRPFVPAVARLLFGATARRRNPSLIREWSDRIAATHVPSMLRCLDALMGRDSVLDRLGDISVPVLVLVGAEDRSLPPPLSRRLHERLPGSRFEIIPDAGHLAALEQPAAVNAAILDFLGSRPFR